MSTADELPPLFTTSPLMRSSVPIEGLSFPKLAIPSCASTDSETVSDWGLESTTSGRACRSPSLISCLFQSQSRPAGQSIQSKPILRKDTASEDGQSSQSIARKQSCLTFDVRCRRDSEAGQSPASLLKIRTTLPTWMDEELTVSPSPLIQSDPESDEGYHEDEEDGFSSDDEVGTFTRTWGTGWASPRPRHMVEKTAEAGPSRHRSVSIVTTRIHQDKCSRHTSPPPRLHTPEPAPPAACSPSATELCRRRAAALPQTPAPRCHQLRGWRSDDSAFLSNARPPRKASLPDSILRKPCSVPMQRSSGTTTPRTVPPLPRRGSACEPSCGVEHMTVLARSGKGGDPRMGLHRALQSVSKP